MACGVAELLIGWLTMVLELVLEPVLEMLLENERFYQKVYTKKRRETQI